MFFPFSQVNYEEISNVHHYVVAFPSVAAFGLATIMIKLADVGLAVVVPVKIVIATYAAPSATPGPAGVAAFILATVTAAVTVIISIIIKYLE